MLIAPNEDQVLEHVQTALDDLPEALTSFTNIDAAVEDFPEDKLVQKLGLESPYELLAMYDDGTLTVYRRPVLDVWCESGKELSTLVYEVVVSELGQAAHLSEEEIAAALGLAS